MNMDTIITYLTDLLGPAGPYIALGAVGIFFVFLSVPIMLSQRPDPFERIKGVHEAPSKRGRNPDSLRNTGSDIAQLDRFAQYLEPTDQKEFSATQLKLVQAGYRSKNAVRTFHASKLIFGVAGLLIGTVWVLLFENDSENVQKVVLIIGGLGFAGYYLPSYWIDKRRDQRQIEIQDGFPDALDLLLICVEAGQSLDQSIQKVAREIRHGYPVLAEEFTIIANETYAGKDRATVLRDLSERTGVNDIKAFVTVLVQSATFGTPIGEALRVYAAEMRDKRVTKAEEKANTLPTKMTLATMMFTVPPLLVILIGPSMYSIYLYLGAAGAP
ncbi:MAG: type II secretion system F family protein [Pseudomonadota bacterium]